MTETTDQSREEAAAAESGPRKSKGLPTSYGPDGEFLGTAISPYHADWRQISKQRWVCFEGPTIGGPDWKTKAKVLYEPGAGRIFWR